MSTKEQRPVLQGQRLKSRKRDEKTKFEPSVFRDEIFEGFSDCDGDFGKATKFLEAAGNELDYHRYGEALLDLLIAGGLLAPGGTLVDDDAPISSICLFGSEDNEAVIKSFAQILYMVIRRYKYLQKALEEEMTKLLLFLKGFSVENKSKLSKLFAYLLQEGLLTVSPLESLFKDSLTRDGDSLSFITSLFQVILKETSLNTLATLLKRAKIENRIMDFFPFTRRTPEEFKRHFGSVPGLEEIVTFQAAQQSAEVKKQIGEKVAEMLQEESPSIDQIVSMVQEESQKGGLTDADVALLLFDKIMEAVEWNKKQDLLIDQAARQLTTYSTLLLPFTSGALSQLRLLQSLQVYCYENQGLLRGFQKLVFILYKEDVLHEDIILQWYSKHHLPKGKTVFLEQMAKFVEWLQNAEEESGGSEEASDN